jgi:hypothetical protein
LTPWARSTTDLPPTRSLSISPSLTLSKRRLWNRRNSDQLHCRSGFLIRTCRLAMNDKWGFKFF